MTAPTAIQGSDLADELRLRRAVVGLWAVVLVFVAITAFRSWQVGIPPRDPGGQWGRTRIAITLGVAIALAVGDATWRVRSPRLVVDELRRRWPRRRIVLVVAGLAAYHVTYFCYHQLKSWNAFRTVQDRPLEAFDVWVFGDSPAELLHQALGVGVAHHLLVTIYESFPTLVAAAFVAPLVLSTRLHRGYVAIATFVWVWILGVGCYYLIPSLGPFHENPAAFTALPDGVVRQTQATYLAQRAHLLADPQANDAYAQIGAFASLHVGVTTVILIVAIYFRLRWISVTLSGYLIGTCLATVYLGWHFVSDDVAGLLIAVLAFGLALRTVGPAPDRSGGG